jgi:hypothetical protein
MIRKILPGLLLAACCLAAAGCGGPGEATAIPEDQRQGLGKPGGDGPGIKDSQGNELPEGLAPVPDDQP